MAAGKNFLVREGSQSSRSFFSQRPSPNHGTSDVLVERRSQWRQFLEAAHIAAGQCVLKIFPRDLHTSEYFSRNRKGIKGKKTYTFDAGDGDVVLGMCVYP